MQDGGWRTFIRYDEEQDRPTLSWALIRRAAACSRPYAGMITVMLGLILVTTLLGLAPPLLVRDAGVRQAYMMRWFNLTVSLISAVGTVQDSGVGGQESGVR